MTTPLKIIVESKTGKDVMIDPIWLERFQADPFNTPIPDDVKVTISRRADC